MNQEFIYQLSKNRSKKMNQSEKNAYHKGWYRDYGKHLKNKNDSIKWAKNILSNADNWVILDTETTGLYNAEIVQAGICNLEGEIILDSLIKPTIPIPKDASNVHKITDDIVKNSPTFPELYPEITKALKDKKVLIYNKAFDSSILNYCCQLHSLNSLDLDKRSECLMEWYAVFCGNWNEYYESYRWQRLKGDHSAIGDCQAALLVLKEMAESNIINIDEVFENDWKKYGQTHNLCP